VQANVGEYRSLRRRNIAERSPSCISVKGISGVVGTSGLEYEVQRIALADLFFLKLFEQHG
jgi:hypothetical protein